MQRRTLLLLFAVAGAARAQAIEGLPPFEGIEISGSADVRFVQGAPALVTVEGDAEMRRRVEVDVAGRTLRIRTSGDWRFWSSQRLQLQVTAPLLARLQINGVGSLHAPGPLQTPRLSMNVSGAGSARLDRLDVGTLRFSASGSGDAVLGGQARELSIDISGRGDVRADNLLAQRARVAISGLGDVSLWVAEDLAISISGIGKVDYWGTPQQVRRVSSGAASVTHRGPRTPAP